LSPLLRVVIPVYNRCACVHEALRSVLDQTFTDFEVLVADDGSSDGTAQVVEEYSALDSRIRLIRLQHWGAASARNAAVEAAGEHKYVAFLDSDDIWFPTHLERAVEALQENPRIGVYFSAVEIQDIAATWSPERYHAELQRLSAPVTLANKSLAGGLHLLDAETCRRAFIMSKFVPMTPTVVVRREAVARAPWFNSQLMVMEDSDFFLFLAATGQSYVFDEYVSVRVRRFGDNLSGTLSPDAMEWWLKSVLLFHNGKMPLCRSREERAFVSSEIASSAFQLGQHYAERLNLRAARSAYKICLRQRRSRRALKGYLACMLPAWLYREKRTTQTMSQSSRD